MTKISAYNIESNNDINKLIKCQKTIQPNSYRRKFLNNNVDYRYFVTSIDNGLDFEIFISYSNMFNNDFSIGLLFDCYLLLRVNGFHGTTKAGFYSTPHHAYPHSHTLTLDDINNARQKHPSKITDLTNQYTDLDTCIDYFCTECGIINYKNYLINSDQMTFEC